MGYFVEVTAYSVKEGAHGGTLGSPVPNQLLRIEEELGADARYPGWDVFPRSAR
jgi:enolase